MTDAAVLQPGGVRRQRVGQPDLVDHPDIQCDVHAHHAEVGEKDGVRPVLRRRGRGMPVRRWLGGIGRDEVPLVVVARTAAAAPLPECC